MGHLKLWGTQITLNSNKRTLFTLLLLLSIVPLVEAKRMDSNIRNVPVQASTSIDAQEIVAANSHQVPALRSVLTTMSWDTWMPPSSISKIFLL